MKFLVPIIIGAIIGYFTNWLAIRMLFRPYEKKRILGFDIPLTPGLIPKERNRISKSIGYTVEEYLLSPDNIMASINEDEIKSRILSCIDKKIIELKTNNTKVGDILALLPNLDENYDRFKDSLVDEFVLSNENKKTISNLLGEHLRKLLNDEGFLQDLTSHIDLNSLLYSDDFIEILNKGIIHFLENNSDRKIKELLPSESIHKVNVLLDENKNLIGFKLRQFIEKEATEGKIKQIINNFIENNISSLITSFIPMDMITDKIYKGLSNYIRTQDAKDDLNNILKNIIKDISDSKLSDLLVDDIGDIDISKHILILKENVDGEELMVSILNTLQAMDKEPAIDIILDKITDILDSPQFRNILADKLDQTYDNLWNLEIYRIYIYLELESNKIYDVSGDIFNRYLKPKLPKLIKSLKISRIVEDTINGFEYDFIEKLVLDIAEKELKAITYLGGLLGGIIGMLTPLIQFLN